MRKNGLVSKYTTTKFKIHANKCNEEKIENMVNREFTNQPPMKVIVSDLTYVRVGKSWNYICVLIDLFNREIIGYSAGLHKDAELVKKAFASTNKDLRNIEIFHTDRGKEFENKAINEVLEAFKIQRSLSKKGCPYDNAVAEATFKILKTEFIYNQKFNSLNELQCKLFDYVNWFNNHRIHSSLGYQTPVQYKTNALKNFCLIFC